MLPSVRFNIPPGDSTVVGDLSGLTTEADKSGNLYGTTNQGGANKYGVVLKIQP
jgi:uncharacterized repeat protein (TIGR03803 family)